VAAIQNARALEDRGVILWLAAHVELDSSTSCICSFLIGRKNNRFVKNEWQVFSLTAIFTS